MLLANINFMPHGHCYLWDSVLIALHVGSDAVIAASYFSIPLALATFVTKRKDLAFHWMFVAFAGFILACGTTHLMAIYTLWIPSYWLSGFVKLITAIVSLITALLLWPLIPRALALPSPAEMKKANDELRNTQAQLVHSAKMASIGQLVAGVAHEVNNPLSFCVNHVHNIQRWMKDLEQCEEPLKDKKWEKCTSRLSEVRQGLDRIGELVQRLRTLSSKDSPDVQQADIHDIISTALLFMKYQLNDEIEVVKDFTDDGSLSCHPTHLSQVFINLLTNAVQSIDGRGTLTIKTTRQRESLQIEIRDTGSGMDQETLKQIFEPFFSTRPVGSGMGLGLAISSQIIEMHHGRIEAESTPGEGSTFRIQLPLRST